MEKLKKEDRKTLFSQLQGGWEILEEGVLRREFVFGNFLEALTFVNKVAGVAEELQHHPDIFLSYGKVTLELATHDAGGLTQKDFETASRVDML